MNEHDPLNTVLREWEAPGVPAALDARVRAAYRETVLPPWWRQLWSARISIPAPVLLAAVLIVAAGVWLGTRPGPPARPAPASPGYVTRLESAGFQPLPDGACQRRRADGDVVRVALDIARLHDVEAEVRGRRAVTMDAELQ